MCVVSNIGDYGRKMWPGPFDFSPPIEPWEPYGPVLKLFPSTIPVPPYSGPTKAQFEEFLELMRAAKKFDVAAGQADCPSEDKTGWMRELARLVGVDPAKVDEILRDK